MAVDYRRAVKRSVTIAGHETSIALEPAFWAVLDAAAAAGGVPLNVLIAQVDADRLTAKPSTNLSSALRLWALAHCRPNENASH